MNLTVFSPKKICPFEATTFFLTLCFCLSSSFAWAQNVPPVETVPLLDDNNQFGKVELQKCPGTLPTPTATYSISAKTTDGSVGKFRFTLFSVSSEPGECLNWPKADSTATPPVVPSTASDFQFSPQAGFQIGENSDVATTTAAAATATVSVKCSDYGAYGKIRVEFSTDNFATVEYGREVGKSLRLYTNLPLDDNDNYIADGASQDRTKVDATTITFASTDDAEGDPVGNGRAGDSFTRYEEYRGWMHNGSHLRTNTAKKTVFVYQEVKYGYEVSYFSELGYETYFDLKATEVQSSNVQPYGNPIKLNIGNSSLYRPSYGAAIRITGDGNAGGIYTRGNVDTGATCFFATDVFATASVAYKKLSIAHELGHAVYLDHPPVVPTGPSGGHGNAAGQNKLSCLMNAQHSSQNPTALHFCTSAVTGDPYICKVEHRLKGLVFLNP